MYKVEYVADKEKRSITVATRQQAIARVKLIKAKDSTIEVKINGVIVYDRDLLN